METPTKAMNTQPMPIIANIQWLRWSDGSIKINTSINTEIGNVLQWSHCNNVSYRKIPTWVILKWYCCIMRNKPVDSSATWHRSWTLKGSVGHGWLAKDKSVFTWRNKRICWQVGWSKSWQAATTKTVLSGSSKKVSYTFTMQNLTRRVTMWVSVVWISAVMVALKA